MVLVEDERTATISLQGDREMVNAAEESSNSLVKTHVLFSLLLFSFGIASTTIDHLLIRKINTLELLQSNIDFMTTFAIVIAHDAMGAVAIALAWSQEGKSIELNYASQMERIRSYRSYMVGGTTGNIIK